MDHIRNKQMLVPYEYLVLRELRCDSLKARAGAGRFSQLSRLIRKQLLKLDKEGTWRGKSSTWSPGPVTRASLALTFNHEKFLLSNFINIKIILSGCQVHGHHICCQEHLQSKFTRQGS